MRGIDVAKWNEIKNYDKLKEQDIAFAIVKVINKSNQPDGGLERHLKGFAGADIPVIAGYNYLYATTEADARAAAKACVAAADGRIPKIYADIEADVLKTITKAQLNRVIKAYLSEIETAGLAFGIYCNQDWYDHVIAVGELNAPFWIARYGKNDGKQDTKYMPKISHDLDGWQYSSKMKLDGISGDVDIDEWYADLEASAMASEVTLYDQKQFIREMAAALGMAESSTGKQALAKTVTISTKTNKNHACVTALERYMKQMGFYTGSIEADLGKMPVFGNGMAKATVLFQSQVVGLKKPDGIWSGGKQSYAAALGCR